MKQVLIVDFCLRIGGGEKLVYELAKFSIKNNIKPTVLIVDNYTKEYYDDVFKEMNVTVVRTRLDKIFSLRNPFKIIKALFWRIKLKFFSAKEYDSIHVINLYTADKIKNTIIHKKRFFWHVGNSVQYPEYSYNFSKEIFSNANDNIVLINQYQKKEIENQYGKINAGFVDFKLFLD